MPGSTFECTAVGDSGKTIARVRVTVKDQNAVVDFEDIPIDKQ